MLDADVLIPATPSQYFWGAKLLLAVPWQLWTWQTANQLLVLHAYSSQGYLPSLGKVESLNKHIWLACRVQGAHEWGCWTVLNTQTATVIAGSQFWLITLFKGCSLWVFYRRWVGGWLWSLTLFASCHQLLQQIDPPVFVSWWENKWWSVLSIFSRVSLGCQPAILCSWQQSKHSGGEIHQFSFPVVLQGRKNKIFLPSCCCYCYRSGLLVMVGVYILHTIAGAEHALEEGRQSD